MNDYETQTRWSVPPSFPWEQWSETRGGSTSCVIDLRDVPEALREVDMRIEQLRQARTRLVQVHQEDVMRNTALSWDYAGPYRHDELRQHGDRLSEALNRSALQTQMWAAARQSGHTASRTYAEQMAALDYVVTQMSPVVWRIPGFKKQEDNDFTNRDEGGVV